MKTQLIWRWDTFIDVLLAMVKIVFAWILWGILFEGKEQISGMGFYTMISYYIISSYLYQLDKSSDDPIHRSRAAARHRRAGYLVRGRLLAHGGAPGAKRRGGEYRRGAHGAAEHPHGRIYRLYPPRPERPASAHRAAYRNAGPAF